MHGSTLTTDGQTTKILLDSLIPHTMYNISVSAATVIGFGPYSSDLVAKTLQAGKIMIFSCIT